MAYQRAYFPMEVINISQGYGANSSTHKLSYALDLSGKDGGKDKIYAPFDCKITKLYQPKDTVNHANTVWITSTKKVLCPNGYYGYLTMSITHPSEISKMRLGCTYKQGEVFCYEGTTGHASGNHIHLELAEGKHAGWSKKKAGSYTEYVIDNKVKPEEYLFAYENAIIKNNIYKDHVYYIIKEKDITYKVKGTDGSLNMRKKPKIGNNIIKTIKENSEVLRFYEKDGWAYIYYYSDLGYVVDKYLKK